VVVYPASRPALSGVLLKDNRRAGLVAQDPAVTPVGKVDIQIAGCSFVDGEFGIVVNLPKVTTPAAPSPK